jgi:ring-1,2-phenylacetyl-CoA epoxidase subunit PaaE
LNSVLTYTLTIVELRKETSDTITLVFKQPGLKKVKYKAGQYITLTFRINNRRYSRPYSFSSAPGVDNYLEVTVKRVPGGIVSNHVCDQVKVGDTVEVLQPLGEFTVEDKLHPNGISIVLWGVGSGITPLFSITKYLLTQSVQNHVTLVYGNRNHESIIFHEQIKQLQSRFPATFTVWHFRTQLMVEESQPNLVQGRIQPSVVINVLNKEKTLTDLYHFICGPAGLKESIKKTLQDYNVPTEKIYSEDFELIKDEKDFKDIFTQNVNVFFEGVHRSVEVVKGRSILEAGLDAGIEMPYSCQTGNCSVCKGKLMSGKVKQIVAKHPDLRENEFQLCCTYPLDGEVQVMI